jgi:hypothetical protein
MNMSLPTVVIRQSKNQSLARHAARTQQQLRPTQHALADVVALAVSARFNPLVLRVLASAYGALLSVAASSATKAAAEKEAEEALCEAERLEGAFQRALVDAGLLGAAAAVPPLATHHSSLPTGGQTFAQLADAVVHQQTRGY